MPVQMRQAIRGTKRAQDAIRRFYVDQNTINDGAREIFSYFRGRMRENFESEGKTAGAQWEGYTGDEKLYGIIKRILIGNQDGARLLRWSPGSERLFPSLVSQGHPEHIEEVNGPSLRFGTAVPYAGNHQHGIGRGPLWAGRPTIKRRPFLTITAEDAAEVRRIMARVVGI